MVVGHERHDHRLAPWGERLQQLAIPVRVVDLLERFGSSMHCGGGAERLFFDKAATRRLKRHLGGDQELKGVERWLNTYAVIGYGGRLVTVGHRIRRFQRR
jgi:hypothetical protein